MLRDTRGNERSRTSSLDLAIGLCLFAAAFVYFHGTLRQTLELRDEGYLLFNIARTARGEVPHRDFAEIYGPGYYALTAPVFRIFGERVLPLREVLAGLRAAAVAFAYLIARGFVPRPFALLGGLVAAAFWGRSIYSLNAPYAVHFTIPLCMASLLLLLRSVSQGRPNACFWAGVIAGVAALVKWSLAIMSAYGMLLAICASAMLREPATSASRARRAPLLVVWALSGAAVVLPFIRFLTASDYLLHIAPIHALLALIGLRFARFGDARGAFERAAPLIGRYVLGFVVLPTLTAIVYLHWGALGDLLYDSFVRPLRMPDYYQPIAMPSRSGLLVAACLIAWVVAALAWLGRSRLAGSALCAAALGLSPFALQAIGSPGSILPSLQDVGTVLPSATALAAVACLAVDLARRQPAAARSHIAATVTALFFQEMMAFQIFPRGNQSLSPMLGTIGPMVAFLAFGGFRLAAAGPAGVLRRGTAFALAALAPVLLVSQTVRTTLAQPSPRDLGRFSLSAPAFAGILPKPKMVRSQHLAEFDELVVRLGAEPFSRGPLFVMNNEPMIYFATRRTPLFADHFLALFLAGWRLLPEDDPATPTSSQLIDRLAANPGTIVIARDRDVTTDNFVEAYPEVDRYIRDHYRVERQIGRYRLMRRARAD